MKSKRIRHSFNMSVADIEYVRKLARETPFNQSDIIEMAVDIARTDPNFYERQARSLEKKAQKNKRTWREES